MFCNVKSLSQYKVDDGYYFWVHESVAARNMVLKHFNFIVRHSITIGIYFERFTTYLWSRKISTLQIHTSTCKSFDLLCKKIVKGCMIIRKRTSNERRNHLAYFTYNFLWFACIYILSVIVTLVMFSCKYDYIDQRKKTCFFFLSIFVKLFLHKLF